MAWAVKQGRLDILQMYLKAGVDTNFYTLYGVPMLSHAAYEGQIGSARILLRYGADPCLPTLCGGQAPLMYAVYGTLAKFRDTEGPNMVELVLRAGAKITSLKLFKFICCDIVNPEHLVQLAIMNGTEFLALKDTWGETVLHKAVRYSEGLTALISKAAPELLHERTSDGGIVLYVAVDRGCVAAARYLIALNEITDVVNMDGETALHIAVKRDLKRLGTTESVIFVSPPEVHQSILDARQKSVHDSIDSSDVLSWLINQTCNNNRDLQPLYLSQGIDFCQRMQASIDHKNFLSDSDHRNDYTEHLKRPEQQTLEQLYQPQSHEQCDLIPQVKGSMNNAALEEVEQEREVVFEIEQEREIQRPLTPFTKRMLQFDRLDYCALPSLPKGWSPPPWLPFELGILAVRLYFNFSDYEFLLEQLRLDSEKPITNVNPAGASTAVADKTYRTPRWDMFARAPDSAVIIRSSWPEKRDELEEYYDSDDDDDDDDDDVVAEDVDMIEGGEDDVSDVDVDMHEED
ncbi:Ankyrin repeat-containing domain-containing protein [Aspergillus oryzae]|uniref:Ankyrin repeat-containing domain-containing protein n=1 Tax=Aspergillus oryzae TaxID=5062 RepID=A0A1S9D9A5_ASPOZ|nr:Ankyrin repeat-containing domain-containing protein [Aspergillus oryzae]